jgi:hypothetical protein
MVRWRSHNRRAFITTMAPALTACLQVPVLPTPLLRRNEQCAIGEGDRRWLQDALGS